RDLLNFSKVPCCGAPAKLKLRSCATYPGNSNPSPRLAHIRPLRTTVSLDRAATPLFPKPGFLIAVRSSHSPSRNRAWISREFDEKQPSRRRCLGLSLASWESESPSIWVGAASFG